MIHDHLVKFWFNLLKKLYTSPILPKDSKIFLDMNLDLNGLNVYKPLFHLDLKIIFTVKEIFLKCRFSMLFSF